MLLILCLPVLPILFPGDAVLCLHTLYLISLLLTAKKKKNPLPFYDLQSLQVHVLSMHLELLHLVEMLRCLPPAFNLQLSVPRNVLVFFLRALLAGGLSVVQNKSRWNYIGHHFVCLGETTSRLSTS